MPGPAARRQTYLQHRGAGCVITAMPKPFTRRLFLSSAAAGTAGVLLGCRSASADIGAGPVTFGLITDVHHRIYDHNETHRVRAFVDHARERRPDFIIQNGDWSLTSGFRELRREWDRFEGPSHHVMGNHDLDDASKEQFMRAFGMPAPYYSFRTGGFVFIVLDRNHFRDKKGNITPYDHSNWYAGKYAGKNVSIADPGQLKWLKTQLDWADRPVVIFTHQTLVIGTNQGNSEEITSIIDAHNSTSTNKVVAVLSGHDHKDIAGVRNGVHYVGFNSASYSISAKYDVRYYRDALHTFVTLDPKGEMLIEGMASSYRDEPVPEALPGVVAPVIEPRRLPIA